MTLQFPTENLSRVTKSNNFCGVLFIQNLPPFLIGSTLRAKALFSLYELACENYFPHASSYRENVPLVCSQGRLPQITRIIFHNQLALSIFGRCLRYLGNYVNSDGYRQKKRRQPRRPGDEIAIAKLF